MSAANGHAHENGGPITGPPTALEIPTTPLHSAERVKELVAALEVPFDLAQIEWRVTNTTQNQQPPRGQVIPYADQRAYTDRLNALLTPAGWTRRYTVHTSANFERAKDKRIVAKVLVTCELTIFGLGSHSATGEEWADNDNAGTAAEAQAFKRACSCFELGRYLYHFTGAWVDLDERKRPKNIPRLFGWATPQGWREGLRPGQEANSASPNPKPAPDGRDVSADRRCKRARPSDPGDGRTARLAPVSWAIEDRGKSLESNRDSRRECFAQGIGANAVSGTWPAAPGGCFEQSWTRSSSSDSPLLATQFDRPRGQSGDSQESRARV
jgi:hypothetical protein